MKFISWNVNGLRACVKKGFEKAFIDFDADFVCLQETKLQAGQIDLEFVGYRSFWNYAEKKGYSGTAIYSRHAPLSVANGIGIPEHDREGRVITFEMPQFFLVCCYTPNAQDGLRRIDYRLRWERDFYAFARQLSCAKPVIICGDLNVAHEEIDLKIPKANRQNAGFSDDERRAMSGWLGSGFQIEYCQGPTGGFVDSFRLLHPDAEKYSWWSYRAAARSRNIGWRIDYFLVGEQLREKIVAADILDNIEGSDHCPVMLEIAKVRANESTNLFDTECSRSSTIVNE
ncbi:MAG: exodeoxyribonuclease III [Prevotella sp.]|nr:exodeoxyribonuclease III [Prevotella sp.]